MTHFLKTLLKTAIFTCIFVICTSLFVVYIVPIIFAEVPTHLSNGVDSMTRQMDNRFEDIANRNNAASDSDVIDVNGLERGTITKIVDGDTLDVGTKRIRLALVNTPERDEMGYQAAVDFTASQCRVGSTVFYDPDDGQRGGSYGRVIALVWCGADMSPNASLNALLIENGHAGMFTQFCRTSEFSTQQWAENAGC